MVLFPVCLGFHACVVGAQDNAKENAGGTPAVAAPAENPAGAELNSSASPARSDSVLEPREKPGATGVAEQDSGTAAGFDEFDNEFGPPKEEGPAKKIFDPLRGYNRLMYHFNDKVFLYAWKPLAKGYAKVVPEPARVAVNRAFFNFRFPVRFGNCLFQLRFKKAGVELGRFLVNSTVGLAGFFDPSDKWLGWQAPQSEDFGQTLGRYGVGDGFPIVLPFFGPSNVRDGLGMIPDIFMNPVAYFISTEESVEIASGEVFNKSSLHLEEYESLKKDALDPYTFLRDVYKQNRDKRIQE